MKTISISVITLLLGVAWTAAPVLAGDAADKVERKVDRAADKAEHKTESMADKAEDKADRAADKAEDKAERAKDKIEDTAEKAKTSVRNAWKKMSARPNEDVRAAQQALRARGYHPGPIDGIMGPRTEAAMRQYQQAEGLEKTGRLDEATADKLAIRDAASASPRTDATAPAAVGKRQTR